MIICVALPVPLYKEFDYLIKLRPFLFCTDKFVNPPYFYHTDDIGAGNSYFLNPCFSNNCFLPKIGSRVSVPFGSKTLIGIVTGYKADHKASVSLDKIKFVNQCLDTQPIINSSLMQLAQWLAKYYHYPLGDALFVMLPTLMKQGKTVEDKKLYWHCLKTIESLNKQLESLPKSAHRKKDQLTLLLSLFSQKQQGCNDDKMVLPLRVQIAETELLNAGITTKYLRQFAEQGYVSSSFLLPQLPATASLSGKNLALNLQQQQAIQQIEQAIDAKKYQGFLLNGITGSGKTEVYLQSMQSVLFAGKQVLVLVPEISLTPQTKKRFAARFNANILLLHSGISDKQRLEGWQSCRNGQAQIIIGTRSTVLYPFNDLGMIFVDEAHDSSYKQLDSLRYHAVNVALYRAHQLNIPVVLGTATPSLEQLYLVKSNKLTQLKLTHRAGQAVLPRFQLIDAKQNSTIKSAMPILTTPNQDTQIDVYGSGASNNTEVLQDTGLTEQVIAKIRQTLQAGEQVLIFINRRGYAPVMLCNACGWQADCPRCDAHLTMHQSVYSERGIKSQMLKCHHCGFQQYVPTHCPDCHSPNLDTVGIGTSRLTQSLHAIFSNPQTSEISYPVIQIDRDTTSKKGSWDRLYQQIDSGNPAILVGTQMLAKGHHFSKVTLVVMPNTDRGFLSADFRSPEHTAQLMMQVSGRAGRGEKPGQVLIQSLQPDNSLLLKLIKQGYNAFAQDLLADRKIMGLPPYSYAALVNAEGKTEQAAMTAMQDIAAALPKEHQLAVLGPIPAPMHKKGNRYYVHLVFLAKQRQHLHQVLNHWWVTAREFKSARAVKLTLDIDPNGW